MFVLGVIGAFVWLRPDGEPTLDPAEAPVAGPTVEVTLGLSGVTTTSGRAARDLPGADDATDAVLAATERFLSVTTVAPVVRGGEVTRLGELLTPRALAAARGDDRPAVVTEGLPMAAVADVVRATAGVRLLDFGERILLAVVDVDVEVVASGTDGPATRVTRGGELILTPVEGEWLVDGYDLAATRDVGPGFEAERWLWPWRRAHSTGAAT